MTAFRATASDFADKEDFAPGTALSRRLLHFVLSTVVDPIAGSRDPLTRRNACGMANHGHDITMTTRPGAQNAEAVLGVVKGDALDQTRQHFLR